MRKSLIVLFVVINLVGVAHSEEHGENFYLRGRLYVDWFGAQYESRFFSQLSSRLRMEIGNPPGDGWTLKFDIRNRRRLGKDSRNELRIYDYRLTFDKFNNPLFFAAGQMNLYDTGGIGELLGTSMGFKWTPRLLIAGYGGLKPELFSTSRDTQLRKYGFFARYLGSGAKTLALSYNVLSYLGELERRFFYMKGLLPIKGRAVLYGNMEFELAPSISRADRLSRLFLNARINLTNFVDLTTNYSSGRGLDYHGYLLERTQNPVTNDLDLEHFYYSVSYGANLRFKLGRQVRFTIGQRESQAKDDGIQNHTTRLGLSIGKIAQTGVSFYASYNINRGDQSESDSLYSSLSKTFGRLTWTANYSTSFNGLRFDLTGGSPQPIRIENRRTFSNDFFLIISRALAISAQHERTFGRNLGEDLFYLRFIYRM